MSRAGKDCPSSLNTTDLGIGDDAHLLFRVGIFSDEREVEQSVDEVLIGHGGVRKHAGTWMAFSDGAGSFLVGFQAQRLGIPQVGRRRIQLRDERSGVGFQSGSSSDIAIDAMTVVAHTFAVENLPSPQDIAF